MAPTLLFPRSLSFPNIRAQWENPTDILSILLIIGGDIIQRAVASLAGGPYQIAPVAFSFGWVAYGVNTVLSAIGSGKLMPEADFKSQLINTGSGITRQNNSWVLGRVLRDHVNRGPERERGLCVSVFRATTLPCPAAPSSSPTSSTKTKHETLSSPPHPRIPGVPLYDWVWYTGAITILLQLCIAAIPAALYHSFSVLTITLGGTLLALASGALPQWSSEKWACRRLRADKTKTVCLTEGNGSADVMVIISSEGALDIEDLASARNPPASRRKRHLTAAMSCCLAILWLLLLLTVCGFKEHTWYLLAIGSLGMAQNVLAAGVRRKASALGVHLEKEGEVVRDKVWNTLVVAEEKWRGVGLCLIPVFFPNGLRKEEQAWRETRLEVYEKEKEEKEGKAGQ
ncbi:MAG: hypothetical protein M1827_007286 [Pycnora praestabilis]|nr:MAG: hypothetical protein M1827_007286 [Pycnora praestabilis]